MEPPAEQWLQEAEEEMSAPPDLITASEADGNAAEEMCLTDNFQDDRLLLFQLPNMLPVKNPEVSLMSVFRCQNSLLYVVFH